jgi:DNA-binding response OmpR family regulator
MAKILVVEDDLSLSRTIEDLLKAEHHQVELVVTGGEALHLLKSYEYDALILDWNLPETTGIEICKQYRGRGGSAAIIMLTANGSIDQKETGFNAGADDYLTKPFHYRELASRLRSLLRRPPVRQQDSLNFNDLTLDVHSYTVSKAGREIKLPPKEFRLLEFLLRHPGHAFSPEALLDRVWRSDEAPSNDSVRVCINRLRKKLDEVGQRDLITNIHGVGYKLG